MPKKMEREFGMKVNDDVVREAFEEYFKGWSGDHFFYDIFRVGWDAGAEYVAHEIDGD